MRFKTDDVMSASYEVMKVVEGEKRKIAANLHDTTLQTLAYFIHKLELIKIYIDTDPELAKEELSEVLDKMSFEIDDVRAHVDFLRPMVFDDLSLKISLEQKIIKMMSDFPINFNYSIEDINLTVLDDKLTVYRILQEVITNAIKHSECQNIDVSLFSTDRFIIADVEDDGKGFDTSIRYDLNGEHFGLLGLKDRVELLGGTINYFSVINVGTKVHIEIPYYD